MTDFDIYGGFSRVTLKTPAIVTSTANTSSVDRLNYAGSNAVVTLACGPAAAGTAPTLDVKIQDSADNSSFADVSGATFTQVTTTASIQHISLALDGCRRYLRAVLTVGGTDTPTFYPAIVLTCLQKHP